MSSKITDPGQYGLSTRTILTEIAPGHIGIVKNRKSRIIMKDGERILKDVNKIRKISGDIQVSLITSAPVCSKTKEYLKGNHIEIINSRN